MKIALEILAAWIAIDVACGVLMWMLVKLHKFNLRRAAEKNRRASKTARREREFAPPFSNEDAPIYF